MMSVFGDNTGELDPNQVIQQEATNVPAPVDDVHNKELEEKLRDAVIDGNTEEVMMLLNRGVDVDATDENGWSPLMYASAAGLVECVKLLLDKGAQANLQDTCGVTPLVYASGGGHVECVKLLMDRGAQANLQDKGMVTNAENTKAPTVSRSTYQVSVADLDKVLLEVEERLKIDPAFDYGYYQKSVTCTKLQQYENAMRAAEAGYKLSSNGELKRLCVEQWITANNAMFKPLLAQLVIETKSRKLTMCISLTNLEVLRSYLEHCFSSDIIVIKTNLTLLMTDLDRLLHAFGRNPLSYAGLWVEMLFHCQVPPGSQRVPDSNYSALLSYALKLCNEIESIDPLLHIIIGTLISLAVRLVVLHCNKLNDLVVQQHACQLLCQACWPLLVRSWYPDEIYRELIIDTYDQFFYAWMYFNDAYTTEEEQFLKEVIESVETLNLSSSLLFCRLVELRISKNPHDDNEVKIRKFLLEYLNSHSIFGKIPDADFITCVKLAMQKVALGLDSDQSNQSVILTENIDSLMEMKESELATEAFVLVESMHMNNIRKQIQNLDVTIDEIVEYFYMNQLSVLELIGSFRENSTLVANMIVKWKSIYNEFRAVLIQLGAGQQCLKTFQTITDKEFKHSTPEKIQNLVYAYKANVKSIINTVGTSVLSLLYNQTYKDVQSVLQPDQLVIEYHLDHMDNELAMDLDFKSKGLVIVLASEGEPLVVRLERVVPLINKWLSLLEDTDREKERMMAAFELGEHIFPVEIREMIKNKRLYLCTDGILGICPLELLPMEQSVVDAQLLKPPFLCSVTYLSSCRELIRHKVLSDICIKDPTFDVHSLTETEILRCVILADPNFDLSAPKNTLYSLWSYISTISFFSFQPIPSHLKMLKGFMIEADTVRKCISSAGCDISTLLLNGDQATISEALRIESPFILHFITHGYSESNGPFGRRTIWDDATTGLYLAGANVYLNKEYDSIHPDAGTGMLTSLAASGMNLKGTRLVYISTCNSAHGSFYDAGYAVYTLAHAFRAAGAQTIIGTLWELNDRVARNFAEYFYEKALTRGTAPSRALAYAKLKTEEKDCSSLWGSFICIGEDKPLFD